MKRAITYQLILLAAYGCIMSLILRGLLPPWLANHQLLLLCAIIGGGAGAVYCLRSVYVTVCIREKAWSDVWIPWYFIRPIESFVGGLIAYFFLKAGLLVLNASNSADGANFGYYAIAFIAGYNVEKFMLKIEQLAETTWGIDLSPSSARSKKGLEGNANKDSATKGAES